MAEPEDHNKEEKISSALPLISSNSAHHLDFPRETPICRRSPKKVRASSDMSEEISYATPVVEFTRIVPRDEVYGTPAVSSNSLSKFYKEAMADEDSGYGSPGMLVEHAGRPCKMGLEKLDIITELKHHEPALLNKITRELSDGDIVRFSCVCQEWRNIVKFSPMAALRKKCFLLETPKPTKDVKENYPKQPFLRDTVSAATPLGEVQRLGEPQASSTPAPRLSNHDKFRQASESLLADESLTKCAKDACQSPAKLLMNGQRAQCMRCGYDFCTNCRCEFHVSSVCPAFREKNSAKKKNSIGSGKSKRSLRRLARLESYP
ncbi:F-box only protein 43-like [Acanthaster planci]|uniref:F-box only protein 43-like n=1 Tax=Acanthaster planci TaxID=133434 RepID=A0A8B7YAM8_ACAPL|nr:F-box only protein 43-like [Acanthaster planci]